LRNQPAYQCFSPMKARAHRSSATLFPTRPNLPNAAKSGYLPRALRMLRRSSFAELLAE